MVIKINNNNTYILLKTYRKSNIQYDFGRLGFA